MTEYKLNTYIEWTDKDRAKGECPVPEGADVTVWLANGSADRDSEPESWCWGRGCGHITAYLVHSVPREPIVRWMVVGGQLDGYWWAETKENAEQVASLHGGRVVKLVEEME
jgi:hypothetical protein